MSERRLIVATLATVAALAVVGGPLSADFGARLPARTTPTGPPTQTPLLGRPDPAGPTDRGVFVRDPRGQIEHLAATGRLVAWSVRTPADRAPASDEDADAREQRRTMPTSSSVIVVDERGGKPLVIDFSRRRIDAMRMLRGTAGASEPQLAVRSCTSRTAKSCRSQLWTLPSAAPLSAALAATSEIADDAVDGFVDRGRRLERVPSGERSADEHGPCLERLRVRDIGSEHAGHPLPPVPEANLPDDKCTGGGPLLLRGRYAFATVSHDSRSTSMSDEVVYGIDVDGGRSARWRAVQFPYRYSDGSTGYEVGPAVRDSALLWEEMDTDYDETYSLEQVALPRDIDHVADSDKTATTSDPIKPAGRNVCQIAATDDALYELANPRCSVLYGDGAGGGEIRRLVHPRFEPSDGFEPAGP